MTTLKVHDFARVRYDGFACHVAVEVMREDEGPWIEVFETDHQRPENLAEMLQYALVAVVGAADGPRRAQGRTFAGNVPTPPEPAAPSVPE